MAPEPESKPSEVPGRAVLEGVPPLNASRARLVPLFESLGLAEDLHPPTGPGLDAAAVAELQLRWGTDLAPSLEQYLRARRFFGLSVGVCTIGEASEFDAPLSELALASAWPPSPEPQLPGSLFLFPDDRCQYFLVPATGVVWARNLETAQLDELASSFEAFLEAFVAAAFPEARDPVRRRI